MLWQRLNSLKFNGYAKKKNFGVLTIKNHVNGNYGMSKFNKF